MPRRADLEQVLHVTLAEAAAENTAAWWPVVKNKVIVAEMPGERGGGAFEEEVRGSQGLWISLLKKKKFFFKVYLFK